MVHSKFVGLSVADSLVYFILTKKIAPLSFGTQTHKLWDTQWN